MTAAALAITLATRSDACEIAALRSAVARELTSQHGHGHWSSTVTEAGVLRGIATSRALVARRADLIVGTLRLTTKRPWAIDASWFTAARRPLYLVDMAVAVAAQRQGIGAALIASAKDLALAWPADTIRLDAYDGPMGAGPFYARCDFRHVGKTVYRGVPLVYFEWLSAS
jgi:GNAT superfamily N-acetyltransferase